MEGWGRWLRGAECFGGGHENILKLTVVMVIRVTFKWYVNGVVWFVNYISIKLLKKLLVGSLGNLKKINRIEK